MKLLLSTLLFGCLAVQPASAQLSKNSAELDVMAATVNAETLDSVPMRVSVPKNSAKKEIMFPVSGGTSGEIFITGTPYDSLGINLPFSVNLTNQYGEKATLYQLQAGYGTDEEKSMMDVLPPADCAMIQVPATGRVYVSLGGKMVSETRFRGTYTGTAELNCSREFK